MIQKIKKNKLRSICIGLSAFLFGFITVTLFNNINDTYAVNTDPVCPAGWQAPISDVNAKYCCPKNFTYNGTACISQQLMTKEECSLYGGETDGVNTLSLCATQRRYREAPACYKCNSSTYLWGNYSPVSSCTKTSLTYENCKTPTYSCYICDVNSNGSKGYSWGTSAPSETCKSGSWYKSNTITAKADCAAPACWICNASSNAAAKYIWQAAVPSASCSSGSWYKSSTITSRNKCTAPTTTTYSITFYPNASLTGNNKATWTSPGSGYYREGTVITSCSATSGSTCSISSLPTISRDGYTFSGWSTNSSCSAIANLRTPISLGKNLNYYACWKTTTTTPTAYKVTFYANGGKFSNGTDTWIKTVYGGERNYFSQMEIPTLTKSGCTADGWYMTNASGTVYRQYFDTGDATEFYAHWSCSSSGGETGGGETPTPTTYTVKYDANGGTGAPSNQTKKQGESLTISTAKPTKTGYTFTSWNTKKDGTGTKYDIGASYTVDADLTLYAQYKENTVTYTVKYDANGGTGAPSNQTKTKGTDLVLSDIKPTKEGYIFVNWNIKKDGTGSAYAAGGKYSSNANVILYAQYEKELNEDEVQYTITFYMNDDTTEKTIKKVNKGEKLVKIEDPTREGYTFDGWYDKKENGKEYDFTKEVTSDINLYAYWSKIGDKTNEDVNKNSKTGDVLIFIAWTAGIGALTYSVYYFKSRKETI